jgi:hypothetical protein
MVTSAYTARPRDRELPLMSIWPAGLRRHPTEKRLRMPGMRRHQRPSGQQSRNTAQRGRDRRELLGSRAQLVGNLQIAGEFVVADRRGEQEPKRSSTFQGMKSGRQQFAPPSRIPTSQ